MAYTTVTVKQVDKSRAAVDISGPSVTTVQGEIPIGMDPAVWAFDTLASLNAKDSVATSKPLTVGQVITPAARVPPAMETYNANLAQATYFNTLVQLKVTNAQAKLDAVVATLQSTFASVFP